VNTDTDTDFELKPHHVKVAAATIPEALEYAAATWPDNTAMHIVATGERLTWAQLHDAVGRVRAGLETRGVRPGDKVGIMLRNQIEFPLAWLAVIEAGAVAVPLNPRYTRREVDFVTGDVDASWLIVADDLTGPVADVVPADRLLTASDIRQLRTHVRSPRTHQATQQEIVGIQFTSGTTGLPKGCVHTHEYWTLMGAYAAAHAGDPRSILADHPFYYMQNQFYLMTALACGGQIHVTPGLSRSKFMRWLIDYEIDFAWIDEGMLDFPPSADDKRLTLKRAPVDAITPALHRQLEERFDLIAREWYGSTEAGTGVYVPWNRTDRVGTGSMGWCHPLRESKIIDESGAEVAPDEPGELCLRGPGMMLGYHNRPEVNAELFLPGGWFRTGDIVRKSADGEHFYLGRLKDMIRRSGENIAAAEVEQRLLALDGIADAGVIPVPDPKRDEEIKALIVREPGSTLTPAQIVAWCREGLAPFKVPRYIEFRDELPYTGSGKVAKSVLKAEAPFGGNVIDMLTHSAG
jgi:acyl-CoA synthetase (AMP-forming)/AMP-acid ligase II